jgi:hypothetical protein
MNAMIKFLQAVRRLAELGVKKEDIIKFGKIEFGEITELLSKQVDDIYKRFYKDKGGSIFKDKPKTQKKGEVVPIKKKVDLSKYDDEALNRLVDEDIMLRGEADTLSDFGKDYGRVKEIEKRRKEIREILEAAQKNPELVGGAKEGIASLTEKEMVESALKKIANRKRLGTRSQESNIRTAVREFLERRIKDGSLTIPDKKDLDAITGVKQGGVDPIDVFRKAYGEDAIGVVARIEDEFPNAFRGDSFNEIGDNFEKLFKLDKENISSELPTPKKNYGYDEGLMTDEQLKETLEKDLKEKEMLEDFNPTDREPNATGGLTRTSYAMGKGPVLPSDEDPINPFQPKPIGPVLPDKSMMADLGDEFLSPEYEDEFRKFLMMLEESDRKRSMDNIMEMFKKYMLSKEPRVMEAATGGRVQAASGGLAYILKV